MYRVADTPLARVPVSAKCIFSRTLDCADWNTPVVVVVMTRAPVGLDSEMRTARGVPGCGDGLGVGTGLDDGDGLGGGGEGLGLGDGKGDGLGLGGGGDGEGEGEEGSASGDGTLMESTYSPREA